MATPTPPLPSLFTKRLHLRPISWSTTSDLEYVAACNNDPVALENAGDLGMHTAEDVRKITSHMRLSRRTLEDARIRRESLNSINASKRGLASEDEVQLEGSAIWVVYLRQDHDGMSSNEHSADDDTFTVISNSASTSSLTFIGVITLWESDPRPPHMGWVMLNPYHNKGYATEAARAVFHYMRNVYGIEHIMAVTSTRNVRSWRVAQKVGLRRQERTMRLKGSAAAGGKEGEAESKDGGSGEADGKGKVVMWLCEGMKDFAPDVEFALLGGDPMSED